MKQLFNLFLTFMKIGGFTFGGGYAMLPMLQKEVVENKHWATEDELMDYYAIGQCTPGIIAVNTATFVGSKIAGIPGAIFATIGVIFPSWIIITLIYFFVKSFAQYPVVQHALAGITVAVFALVLDSVIKLGKKSIKSWLGAALSLTVFVLSIFAKVSAVYLILASGLVGIVYAVITERRAK